MTGLPGIRADAAACPLYAFEITLHGMPGTPLPVDGAVVFSDALGTWPTLTAPRAALAEPMAIGFDAALGRLDALPRMFVEPDGAFVWTSPREGFRWQVDGNASERSGRVLLVDLKGSCPADAFDALLACFDWPEQRLAVQLVRAGVFFDLDTFRRHAAGRALAGDAETLRPD